MKRLVAALALLPVLATPAHATSDHYGDCGFDTIQQESLTGADRFEGVAYTVTALYADGHGNVVNATVTCEIQVNGVTAATASGWGSGVVTFAERVGYDASETDEVAICTTVDFTSDDTPTWRHCQETTYTQVPPMYMVDMLEETLDLTGWIFGAVVDPTVCPVFGGDLYVAGEFVWDCPPYEDGYTPPPPPSVPPLDDYLSPPTPPGSVTGAGYNTGDAGLLVLTSGDGPDTASACGYVTDHVTGVVTIAGSAASSAAADSAIRCRLEDAAGAVLYDETVTAHAPFALLHDSIGAPAGPITVCVGLTCRPGEPLT